MSQQPPPGSREPAGGPVRALLSAFFHLYLLVGLLLAICLILASALIRASAGDEFIVDVVRDLGIGLLVSVFVVVFIEWRAGLTLRSEIAADVLEAVYRRTVPRVIFDQIQDCTFRSDVLRCDWKLEIAVLDAREHEELYRDLREAAGDNVYVMESTVSYALENLNDHTINYLVTHGIDLDLRAGGCGVPGFTEVKVAADRLEIGAEQRRGLLGGEPHREGGLAMEIDGNEVFFNKQVQLPRSGRTEIRYKHLRAIRAPGIYVVSCATPADGVSIAIEGPDDLAFTVRPLHPQAEAIEESDRGRWNFPFGILPWQGIQVISSPG